MKRRLQIATASLFLLFSAMVVLSLPMIAAAKLSSAQIWLMALIISIFWSILATLFITFIFTLPFDQFLIFLKNILKKNQFPADLPFAAPKEIHETYKIFRDILTDTSKHAESMRKVANYEEVRYRLLTTLTHRLRTPVTGLKWALNELRDHDTLKNQEDKTLIAEALNSTKRMGDIIETLLQTTSVETEYSTVKKEPVDIISLIKDIVEEVALIARSKNCTVTVDRRREAVPTIEGDKEALHLALQNIISNAIYYSKENGTVMIIVDHNESVMILKVIDDGIGISPEEQVTLFERFSRGQKSFTMNTEGTGLGLYITKGIITNHGGEIRLESEVNKGTTVTVELPIRGTGELETFIEH